MKKLILILVAALSLPMAWGQDMASVQQKIVAKSQTINTLSADFVQSRSIKSLANPAICSGKLYFSKPNKMRWEQKLPDLFVILMDGNTVSVKQGDNAVKQFDISSNRMFRQLSEIIAGGITGTIFLDQKNYVVTFSQSNNLTKALLVPKSKQLSKYIASIELTFNSLSVADRITINEANGSQMVVELRAIKINNPIAASVFELK